MKKIDSIKKKIKYRAEYRGIKEMDLLLGRFVKKYIDILTYNELIDLHQILEKDDDVILTINNIPIGNVNDVYKLYKDDTIKTYYVEIKRDNKLRMIEWYK